MGSPFTLQAQGAASSRYAVIGAPWDGGTALSEPGARHGPAAIRAAGRFWLSRVREGRVWDLEREALVDLSGVEIADHGDAEMVLHDQARSQQALADAVAAAMEAGCVPLVLGGDHSITIGAIRGFARDAERIGVIQFDAHLDLVDSSELQGGLSQSSPMRRALELPAMAPERLVQIGLRSFNYPAYREWARAQGITQLTTAQALASGADRVAELALERAGSGGARIWVTVDLDCLDPSVAPGVGLYEPGGFDMRFLADAVRKVAPHAAGIDIAELNPMRDHHDATASVAAKLLLDFATARAPVLTED